MVTLKREERTENRYGGYNTAISGRFAPIDRFNRYAEPEVEDFELNNSELAEIERDKRLWNMMKENESRKNALAGVSEHSVGAKVKKQARVSAKGKILIAVYACVVAFLVSLIISNAISLKAYASEISQLEAEIIESQSALDALKATETLTEEQIVELATERGMIQSEVSGAYEAIPVTGGVVYDTTTNWFDKLCDKISDLFGG